MTTNEIMALIDRYAAAAGMTLVDPCLARAQVDKEARAAVIAAIEQMRREIEQLNADVEHWKLKYKE